MSAYLASLAEATRETLLAELTRQMREKNVLQSRVAELEARRDELQAVNNRLIERASAAEGDSRRLDWLDRVNARMPRTLRQAIDEVMQRREAAYNG